MPLSDQEEQLVRLDQFIDKFDANNAALIREVRTEVKGLLPTAIELVYDNYNFLAIGYGSTERASDAIVSIASAANGVGLCFIHGASLPDPQRLLQGSGSQTRFIRLAGVETLREPAVLDLIDLAVASARTPLPQEGGGYTVIKSVSAKQRPRRRTLR